MVVVGSEGVKELEDGIENMFTTLLVCVICAVLCVC